jgi:choline kinase
MKNIQSHVVPTRRTNVNRDDITIIIMGANIGYGMKSYGPKCLLHINNHETLLEYQINLLRTTFPHADIILVVGFLADRVIKNCPPGVRIIENQLYETTNEVEQIRLALNCALTPNVLIMKDDIIFNSNTLTSIIREEACLLYDNQDNIYEQNVGVTIVNDYATTFSYDMSKKWCHIIFLTEKEKKILQNLCNKKERSRMFLFEVLTIMLQKVGKIKAISPHDMEIMKIDTSKQLQKIQDS